jgi:hypothetical protein
MLGGYPGVNLIAPEIEIECNKVDFDESGENMSVNGSSLRIH